MSCSGRVGLAEGIKQGLLLGPGEAHAGIRDAQAQGYPVVIGLLLFQACPQYHLSGLGKLDGVVDQICYDLFDSQRVTHDVVWHVVVDQRYQIQVLGMGRRRQHDHDFLHDIPQLEGYPVQDQLAGLDLREIEDVVDDGEQDLRRFPDGAQVVPLLPWQGAFQEQFGETDNAIQWRADFMGHVGQEF